MCNVYDTLKNSVSFENLYFTVNGSTTKETFRLNIADIILSSKLEPCGTDGRLLLSGFQALVTLTLTLDRVIRHTVVHQSSTSVYIPIFIEIGKKRFVDGLTPETPPSSRSRDTKTRTSIKKVRPEQIYILCSSFRIGGHLPASIVNGGGDSFKSAIFGTPERTRSPVTLTLTFDLVIRHTVVHQSSTSIYTPNFIEIGKKNFLWTDVCTYGRIRTDVRTYLY